ncbi:Phosphoglucomutase, first 3 domain-containing protein [Auriculariales sp. MPI-PUGE-AT-0066]|nr:Phosphoglucomutase, first 3 domain-containing protein [Auriculariales sp. MPI-PUGE-AT-0066]
MASITDNSSLDDLVQAWLKWDRNDASRNEIKALHAAGNITELEQHMKPRLEFGTAGLRGPMRAGFSGLNDLMVVQTGQGVARYAAKTTPSAEARGVVIGHDHRHNSARWATMTAAAFGAQGYKVHVLEGNSFTPLVPFAVTHLKAAIGIMITASHNPGQDNGIKIYWENGVQIIAPHDEGIAQSIVSDLAPASWDKADGTLNVTEEITTAYFATVIPSVIKPFQAPDKPLRLVHTSLHGVGERFMRKAVAQLGGAVEVMSTPEQADPNPDFPTTAFPNPEEKGTLDLAMAFADNQGVHWIVANDPDADRFAAAEKVDGKWRILTGNEIGIMLAAAMLDQVTQQGLDKSKVGMITTVVSSKMLRALTEKEGLRYSECLTGFKNLGNLVLSMKEQDVDVMFSYEEALGYAVSPLIRDKDGISALIVFVQLLFKLQSENKSLHGYLAELHTRYGYFESRNASVRCGQPKIAKMFLGMRQTDEAASPAQIKISQYPDTLGGLKVVRVVDVTLGYDSSAANRASVLGRSPGQMIQFFAEDAEGSRLYATIRASGTEPKVKYYLEATGKDTNAILTATEQDLLKKWLAV